LSNVLLIEIALLTQRILPQLLTVGNGACLKIG